MVFTWQPKQLQIIADNKPPYSLAIDLKNTDSKSSSAIHNQIFNELVSKTKPTWVIANLISLNVEPDKLAKTLSVDWKQWIFWLVLVIAVIVLLVFSLKLFKQVNLAVPKND